MVDTPGNASTYDDKRPDPMSTSSHVDVKSAEEEFNTLSRQLTIRSQKNEGDRNKLNSSATTVASNDVEKGAEKGEPEYFDLREYLSSSNDANQQAGVKHKVCSVFGNFKLKLNYAHLHSMWELSGKTSRLMLWGDLSIRFLFL